MPLREPLVASEELAAHIDKPYIAHGSWDTSLIITGNSSPTSVGYRCLMFGPRLLLNSLHH